MHACRPTASVSDTAACSAFSAAASDRGSVRSGSSAEQRGCSRWKAARRAVSRLSDGAESAAASAVEAGGVPEVAEVMVLLP